MVTDQILQEIIEKYLQVLAGQNIRLAIRSHATKCGLVTKYIDWDVAEHTLVRNVFMIANNHEKLLELVKTIKADNYPFDFPFLDDTAPTLLRIQNQEDPNDPAETSDNVSQITEIDLEIDDRIYRRYLKSQIEFIDIRGIGERRGGDAVGFPILDLYTELYVQTGLTNFDLNHGRIRGRKRISLSEMLKATSKLVIMGDPGSGKTTFLRYVAMKEIVNQESKQRSNPLPIYLRLADIYEYAQDHNKQLTPDILLDYFMSFSEREHLRFTRADLTDRFEKGECLWLLDSLDELPSTESREKIVALIEDTCRKWDKCRYILTSRPIALKGMAIPISFEVVGIDDWGSEEIGRFLQAWTSLLYVNWSENKRRHHWGALLNTILENHELQGLARNAVMLTAMAVVHYNEKHLPEGKADLFEAVIYWLIRSRNRENDNIQANAKFIEDRYKEIALAMFESEGGRRNRVGRGWAAERVMRHFDGGIEDALRFLDSEEETGILIRRGEGDLTFWHLSFQEYLAAKEIAGKTDDEQTGWWYRLKDRLDETEWREVLTLVPSCLNRLGGERVDLFFDRLGECCVDEKPVTKAKRVALGGSILKDLRLTGYTPSNTRSWFKVLNEVQPMLFSEVGLTPSIPLETRYEAAVAYGLGGDPRLRNFEETWISIPPGKIYIGAQSKEKDGVNYDAAAAPWEGPVLEIEVKGFEIRKYPITVEEYAKFIEDEGYSESAELFWGDDAWRWKESYSITTPLDWEQQLLTPNCPIVGISWCEANAYCNWLTRKDMRKKLYRLPCEFEWEYVARKDLPKGQNFPWGDSITYGEGSQTNWAGSFLRRCVPVGMFSSSKTPSGVYDMVGNIEEWCADTWSPGYSSYPKDQTIQAVARKEAVPYTLRNENYHVVRGGSTIRFARLCRSTYRSRIPAGDRYMVVGFRPVREDTVKRSNEDI